MDLLHTRWVHCSEARMQWCTDLMKKLKTAIQQANNSTVLLFSECNVIFMYCYFVKGAKVQHFKLETGVQILSPICAKTKEFGKSILQSKTKTMNFHIA